jgi:hypothetical protein
MDKLSTTQEFIYRLLASHNRPCVLWSGGKDSMVLLHILRDMTKPLPVVCWREPWLSYKQRFVNRIIDEWSLTVWDWHPASIGLVKGNGRIDVLNAYQMGMQGATITLARGIEKPAEGEKLLCGRDTFMSRPTAPFVPPWDLCFHGHKSCDVDACSGPVPLEVDLMATPGMVACSFPLRHWEDGDIFNYIEEHNVPYDVKRYRKVEGQWEVLPYQKENPDYYPACMKCLDPDEGEFVDCPKYKMRINNISNQVKWATPKAAYCNLRNGENSHDT